MNLKAKMEIVIHFGFFRNIDIFARGLYYIQATCTHNNNKNKEKKHQSIGNKIKKLIKNNSPLINNNQKIKKNNNKNNNNINNKKGDETNDDDYNLENRIASPFALFSAPSTINSTVKGIEIEYPSAFLMQGAQVKDSESTFCTRTFVIRYKDEMLELNDGCQFQAWNCNIINDDEVIIDETFEIKFELFMAPLATKEEREERRKLRKNELKKRKKKIIMKKKKKKIYHNDSDISDTDDDTTDSESDDLGGSDTDLDSDEEIIDILPDDPQYKCVATQTLKIQPGKNMTYHGYYPLTFDNYSFCEADLMVHIALIGLVPDLSNLITLNMDENLNEINGLSDLYHILENKKNKKNIDLDDEIDEDLMNPFAENSFHTILRPLNRARQSMGRSLGWLWSTLKKELRDKYCDSFSIPLSSTVLEDVELFFTFPMNDDNINTDEKKKLKNLINDNDNDENNNINNNNENDNKIEKNKKKRRSSYNINNLTTKLQNDLDQISTMISADWVNFVSMLPRCLVDLRREMKKKWIIDNMKFWKGCLFLQHCKKELLVKESEKFNSDILYYLNEIRKSTFPPLIINKNEKKLKRLQSPPPPPPSLSLSSSSSSSSSSNISEKNKSQTILSSFDIPSNFSFLDDTINDHISTHFENAIDKISQTTDMISNALFSESHYDLIWSIPSIIDPKIITKPSTLPICFAQQYVGVIEREERKAIVYTLLKQRDNKKNNIESENEYESLSENEYESDHDNSDDSGFGDIDLKKDIENIDLNSKIEYNSNSNSSNLLRNQNLIIPEYKNNFMEKNKKKEISENDFFEILLDDIAWVNDEHIFIFVHGFYGNSNDMRLFRDYIQLILPNALTLCSKSNEEDPDVSIIEMGERLAKEVREFLISRAPTFLLSNNNNGKISFIGHSMGSIVIRSALTTPYLSCILNKLNCLITLSTPHLGSLYTSSQLVATGMWALKKWKKHLALDELSLSDAENIEDTYLYKLSKSHVFEYFEQIILVSADKDDYVPSYSALIRISEHAEKDIGFGSQVISMVANLLSPLDPKRIIRLQLFSHFSKATVDTMIGRAAHISYLDSPQIINILIFTLLPFLVK